MILYIHGFGGSGLGVKASLLRKNFSQHNVIAPTLSYVPDLAIDTLSQIIESYKKYEEVYLIGSSLGGYYSIYLANKYNLKAALINPATTPNSTLSKMLGEALNYGDLSKFEWNKNHLQMLNKYAITSPRSENFLLLLQTGDEVIDYKIALEYLEGTRQIVIEGGDHSFVNIEKYSTNILQFFNEDLQK